MCELIELRTLADVGQAADSLLSSIGFHVMKLIDVQPAHNAALNEDELAIAGSPRICDRYANCLT